MDDAQIKDADSSSLAMLADDVTSLVHRMQDDWDLSRQVRPEVAEELHKLRERAERLLFDSA